VTPLVAADLTENGKIINPPVILFSTCSYGGGREASEFRKDIQCWENLSDCATKESRMTC